MTLHDIKIQQAKEFGCTSPANFFETEFTYDENQRYVDMVAIAYAQSQVNEALDKAIIMVENNGDYTVDNGKVYISEEAVIEELKRLKR